MMYALPRERGSKPVSLARPMPPLPKALIEEMWLAGLLDEPTGPTPEEWEASEQVAAALAARYAESDALAAWQTLRGEGLTGADAADLVCGEG